MMPRRTTSTLPSHEMTYLTRADATQNINRVYIVDVMPTLFEEWTVLREWAAAARREPCGTTPTAGARRPRSPSAAASGRRLRRGYR
jgi:hypothetical protein